METLWIINQFAGTPSSGWGERHFYLSGELKKQYKVVIISSGNNHMFSKKAEMKGLFTLEEVDGRTFCWVNTPNYNPKSVMRFVVMVWFAMVLPLLLFKQKKIGRPSVILLSSMSIFPVPVCLLLKKLSRARKFIFEVRDLWPLTPIHLMNYSPSHPVMRVIGWLEKLGYRRADEIVSVLGESDKYINPISGDPDKFHWIPNGIHQELLQQKYLPPRLQNNIPEGRLVVSYMGTIGFANALDPVVELIAQQGELRDKVFFLFIGDGYLKADYEEKLRDVPNVMFIAKVPKQEVQSYLAITDLCFIAWHKSPLYSYGVSANKYMDYLASGTPVLAAQEGINDPVRQSGCGLVVANEVESIREGLLTFSRMSKSQLAAMGEKGRDYAADFTYEKLGKKYLAVLDKGKRA